LYYFFSEALVLSLPALLAASWSAYWRPEIFKRRSITKELLVDLYLEQRNSMRSIAALLGCSISVIQKYVTLFGLNQGHEFYKKYLNTPQRVKVRVPHEFSSSVKKQRFLEEHGVCQFCHQIIGDGTDWRDRIPESEVTYHHDPMVCEGGTNKLEHCMVVHRMCHGGSGGTPLNPLLHNGRKFSYVAITYPECVWCGKIIKVNNLHLCNDCNRTPRIQLCKKCGSSFRALSKLNKFCSRGCFKTYTQYFTEEDFKREARVACSLRDLLIRLNCPYNASTLGKIKIRLKELSMDDISFNLTQPLVEGFKRGRAPRR